MWSLASVALGEYFIYKDSVWIHWRALNLIGWSHHWGGVSRSLSCASRLCCRKW